MNLSGRLAIGMLFPVVLLLLALGFVHGVSWPGILLAGGAVAMVLMTAETIARLLSKPAQLMRVADGLARGEQVPISRGSSGNDEATRLAAALAELSAQLGSRQNLLENTVESIRDPVVVADEHGTVVIANVAARRLLGVEIGFNSVTDVRAFTCYYADGVTIMPISKSPLVCALYGESVDDFELNVRPQPPAEDVCFIVNARPLRDEAGHLRGAVTVLHDVTAQRRAHQALVESEQMAQAIVRTALDAFVQTDQDGIVLDWSPQAEALTGWTRSEAIGQRVVELVFPEELRLAHRQRVARFLQETAAGGMGMRYETESVHRDGHRFFAEVSLNALRRGDGYVINAFVRDVTQRRIAEEQLIQAQKTESLGRLTGGIAHDFNNILTVITGLIDILAEAVEHDAALSSVTKMISDAAFRGAEVTKHLLAFSRQQPLQPREANLNTLVQDTARLLRPSLGEQIEIDTALEPDAWPAFIDPNHMATALLNLAVNARDAMPDGGKLMLETSNVILDEVYAAANPDVRAGEYVMVAVSDTGGGIPAGIRDKVFEPFFTTKDTGKGTGLGLSMVYGFIKQSDGHLKIYSEEGHGTSIKLYLPRSMGDMVDVEPPPPVDTRGGHESILVVEDDPLVRNYVSAQLEQLGYRTMVTANGPEALAAVDNGFVCDVLFTDVIMSGGMNGRQVADAVVAKLPSVRVLFTSGYTEDAIIHHGRLDPDVTLLPKPYRKADLARMIRQVLTQPPASAVAAK